PPLSLHDALPISGGDFGVSSRACSRGGSPRPDGSGADGSCGVGAAGKSRVTRSRSGGPGLGCSSAVGGAIWRSKRGSIRTCELVGSLGFRGSLGTSVTAGGRNI